MTTIVVTGSRYYKDKEHVDAVLGYLDRQHTVTRLAHGDCYLGGADHLARDWAQARGRLVQPYPYLRELGRAGGPRRNKIMLTEELTKHGLKCLVAFPGDNGTKGCCVIAEGMNIEVLRFGWQPVVEKVKLSGADGYQLQVADIGMTIDDQYGRVLPVDIGRRCWWRDSEVFMQNREQAEEEREKKGLPKLL